MNDLIIVGDEAWTPEEYEARRARQAKENARRRQRRATDPEYRERWNAYYRRYLPEWRSRRAA